MARQPREVFDRERAFAVNKEFRFNGQVLVPGQLFDKTQANARRLRQLYEGLFIRMLPVGEGEEADTEQSLSTMPTESIRTWLLERGATPRVDADRARLLKQAERVLVREAAS